SHAVERHQLAGLDGRELEKFLGEPLDALGAIEQAPFGAEHGETIALGADLLVERGDLLVERARLVFHLIDDIGQRNQAKNETDVHKTQHGILAGLEVDLLQANAEPGYTERGQVEGVSGRGGALGGSQPCRAGPRVRRNLPLIRFYWTPVKKPEARRECLAFGFRQMARGP